MTSTNNIVLIGNGTSVLNSSIGYQIDQFQNIGRFNQFQLDESYSEYIGKNTTHYICHGYLDFSNIPLHAFSQVFILDGEDVPIGNNIIHISNHTIENIIKPSVGMTGKHLTTGLIFILYIKDKFDKIYYHGFDHLSTPHYWDINHSHDSRMNDFIKDETQIFQKLESDGKLIGL
jgi:hypothetical protein